MEPNVNVGKEGKLMRQYMAATEYALYTHDAVSTDELCHILAKCDSYNPILKEKVSPRTLRNVIKMMRHTYNQEYGIDLKESIKVLRRNYRVKYRLTDKARTHLLFPENIFYSKTDRDKLNLLLKVGEYFSLPMEAFLRKENLLKEGASELFSGSIEMKIRSFDSKVFADVFDAVESHHVITFQYKAFSTPQSPSASDKPVVTPYYLKSYSNKWYLIGHVHKLGYVRKSPTRWTVFALDRMSGIKVCKDITPYEIDPKEIKDFYEHVIGFFVPPNPDGSIPQSEDELDIKTISVTVKDEKCAFFLAKNPIHKSQRRSPDNRLKFLITCLDNIHLYQALLRIIDDISWIEPAVVRHCLLEKLKNAQSTLNASHPCDDKN